MTGMVGRASSDFQLRVFSRQLRQTAWHPPQLVLLKLIVFHPRDYTDTFKQNWIKPNVTVATAVGFPRLRVVPPARTAVPLESAADPP